jgi:hypothetical protein
MPHGVDLRWTDLLRELRVALLVFPLTIDRPDLESGTRKDHHPDGPCRGQV